jgi:hypothetical protein
MRGPQEQAAPESMRLPYRTFTYGETYSSFIGNGGERGASGGAIAFQYNSKVLVTDNSFYDNHGCNVYTRQASRHVAPTPSRTY